MRSFNDFLAIMIQSAQSHFILLTHQSSLVLRIAQSNSGAFLPPIILLQSILFTLPLLLDIIEMNQD